MSHAKLTRRILADYTARELIHGDAKKVMSALAAYLLESGRTKETELIVRDIELNLRQHGEAVVDLETAHPIDPSTVSAIASRLGTIEGATNVYVRQHTDPALIGGLKVTIPGQRLDLTIAGRLRALRAQKI